MGHTEWLTWYMVCIYHLFQTCKQRSLQTRIKKPIYSRGSISSIDTLSTTNVTQYRNSFIHRFQFKVHSVRNMNICWIYDMSRHMSYMLLIDCGNVNKAGIRDSPERRISVMNANRKMLSNDFGKTSTSLSNVVLYSQPSPSPSYRQTNKVC